METSRRFSGRTRVLYGAGETPAADVRNWPPAQALAIQFAAEWIEDNLFIGGSFKLMMALVV
jgi:hypothetical protein